MSEADLTRIIQSLSHELSITKTVTYTDGAVNVSNEASTCQSIGDYKGEESLLAQAKKILLKLDALQPRANMQKELIDAAQSVLELGALIAIRKHDADTFARCYQEILPFYETVDRKAAESGNSGYIMAGSSSVHRSKMTGLYMMLLLSQHDYAAFHSLLESLAHAVGLASFEDDPFIQYPIRIERALMEGSYDKVWGETKGERVPSEEFALFAGILIRTIRTEIASCSEKAYSSIPIADAKTLFFLDSEGSVIEFARERGWIVRDGRVYFPTSTVSSYALPSFSVSTRGDEISTDQDTRSKWPDDPVDVDMDGSNNPDGRAGGPAASKHRDSDYDRDGYSFGEMIIANALGYARVLDAIV